MTFIEELPPAPVGWPGWLLGLRSDVRVVPHGPDVEFTHPWGRHRISGLGGAAVALLLAMADRPLEAPRFRGQGGQRLRQLFERLPYLVTNSVADGAGRLLLTAVPMTRAARLPDLRPLAGHDPVVLSRFAYLRRLPGEPDALVLESPLAPYRVSLHSPAAAGLVAALAVRQPVAAAAAPVAGLPAEVAAALAGLLAGCGFLEREPVAADSPTRLWEFHDLLFHARSRAGRHDYPSGGIFAHQEVPQLPAVPVPAADGPRIELPVPSWEAVLARDPALTEVLEGRRSVRHYAGRPVSVDQVGELLYRAARVRRVLPRTPGSPTGYDAVDRPYPTGGATGELELYLAVAECAGLDPGIYRYDAAAHRLCPRHADDRAADELVAGARLATGATVTPQVLITVTSRFGRLSWKYSQIAYALTLKHVGVLYQTLYLVATAMGLAACAVGSGDTEAAARALGLDWTEESTVGEFLIGSRPSDLPGLATGFADVVREHR
jgi:SagB-type dehydrogenase family enzyme